MMQQAQEVVLLADSGKFGQQALSKLADLSEIDTVVTDQAISDDHRKAIESAGCHLIIAS
jgi:DeoR family fructose operon transcriptional repressor